MSQADPIQPILEQWSRERPDLELRGFALVGRVLVLAKHLERRVTEALAPLDLSLWAFDVLATLRRQGAPYRLTPTELSRATMLTTGAMTNRLDRLEAAGHLRRQADPSDRRGILVTLTDSGLDLVDRALEVRMAEANDAVAGLDSEERSQLAAHLSRLLESIDAAASSGSND